MSNFKFQKSWRRLLLASMMLVLAAACNNQKAADLPVPNSQQSPLAKEQGRPDPSAQQQSVSQTGRIAVLQTVQGSNFNKPSYEFKSGQTALDLLKGSHAVKTKNFSGIGEFVEEIDGIKPDSKHFWAFYVNGKSSNVGASSYILEQGDKVEWKLEEMK